MATANYLETTVDLQWKSFYELPADTTDDSCRSRYRFSLQCRPFAVDDPTIENLIVDTTKGVWQHAKPGGNSRIRAIIWLPNCHQYWKDRSTGIGLLPVR